MELFARVGNPKGQLTLLRPGPAHRCEDQLQERPCTEGVNCNSLDISLPPPAFAELLLEFGGPPED